MATKEVNGEKLDLLIKVVESLSKAVEGLTDVVQELADEQAEVIEKLSNVSTPGGAFGFEEMD